MIKRLLSLALALIAFSASAAMAGTMEEMDAAMAPIARNLIEIDKALAADSTEGVKAAAQAILAATAKVKTEGLTSKDSGKLTGIEGEIAQAAQAMAGADTIEAQRDALKALTKPIARWATIRQPEGVYVAYCPMAPGSWLQDEKMISNPYYGASMLRCGQIIERSDKPTRERDKHAGHTGH